jgi:lysophospholipase L1-like esterase
MRSDTRRERVPLAVTVALAAALAALASGGAEARKASTAPLPAVAPLDPSMAGIPLDPSWPKHVFVVTDSVMLGAKQQFINALPDWRVTFTGRPALMIDKGLHDYVLKERDTGPVAVVALGYNTLWEKERRNFKRWADRFDGHVEQMLAALKERGAKKIVWVMLRELTPDMATGRQGVAQYNRYAWYFPYVNERLKAIKARHPEMALADWVDAGKSRDITYDLIHLNGRGSNLMVEVVKVAMGLYGSPAQVAAARPASPARKVAVVQAPLPDAVPAAEETAPRAAPAALPVHRVATIVQSREAAARARVVEVAAEQGEAPPPPPRAEQQPVQPPVVKVAARRLALIDEEPRKPGRSHTRDMFGLSMFHSASVVMLGDSLTQRAQWAEITGCGYLANRGIGGDQSSGVVRRLDEVTALKPSAVFLMIGINDLHRHVPVSTIVGNVRKTIETLNDAGAKVYLTLTLPVARGYVPRMNPTVAELNDAYIRLAKQTNATVVDFRDEVSTAEGALRGDMSVDGLHLNPEGYRVWRDAITPLVRKHCSSSMPDEMPVAQTVRPKSVAVATLQPVAQQPAPPPPQVEPAPQSLIAAEPPAAEVTASIPVHSARGAWIIQIGAFPEEEKAQDRIREAQTMGKDLLARASPFTEKVMKGSQELYRARFAGFSQSAAKAACSYFKNNAIDCISMKR